jgi:hypothetical protein
VAEDLHLRKIRRLRGKRAIIIALFLIVCLAFFSYFLLPNTQCPIYSEAVSNAPEYITVVWPLPNADIEFRCYISYRWSFSMNLESSVSIAMIPKNSFKSEEIDYQEAHPNDVFPPFEDRVSLYVDEKKVKTGVQIAGSDSTPYGDRFPIELEYLYIFKSYPFLFPGDHTSKILITLKNGEIVEYHWHFRISW